MYCGHGSGSQYLSGDEIERIRVRGVPLLLGCSSGQLDRMGRTLDPLGISQSYLMATGPAILGFIWAVTDNDLDNWTELFLEHWLGGKPGGQTELEGEVVWHEAGLQTLRGITCTDTLLQRSYSFNDQCQVYVLTDKHLYQALTSQEH